MSAKPRRQLLETLAWRHAHRDFKGTFRGVKSLLVRENGGSALCPVTDCTDEQLLAKIPHAIKTSKGLQ